MGSYKGIIGQTVQSLGSDITASADTEGQVWYNSSSNVWKMVGYDTGSWSVAPTMAQGRASAVGAPMGTNSGALVYGGPGPLNYQYTMYTEEFNGTSWTEEAKLTATGAAVEQKLGTSVALDGNTLVSGTPGDFQKGTNTGAAHIFTAKIQ